MSFTLLLHRVGIYLEWTHFHYLSLPSMKWEKHFHILCHVQSISWQSGNGFVFPECQSEGQTGDTDPKSTVIPFVLAVAFLWLFAVTEGQKLKLASEHNVCDLFTKSHTLWQMRPCQAHCILIPFLVGFILFFD